MTIININILSQSSSRLASASWAKEIFLTGILNKSHPSCLQIRASESERVKTKPQSKGGEEGVSYLCLRKFIWLSHLRPTTSRLGSSKTNAK